MMFGRLSRLLFPGSDYGNLERRNRIDGNRAFFRVSREIWRFIEGERFVDVYMEGGGRSYFLDVNGALFWQVGKYERWTPEIWLQGQSIGIAPVTVDERQGVIRAIVGFMASRHKAEVEVRS